jgi:BirA family biotin operon repressor/biotin-[acetyl-CoA-carboxylase] ligase
MENLLFLKNIKRYREVGSTNIAAEEWIVQESPPEGSAVVAKFQTNGAGMAGNTWESQHGKNLLISFVLYPHFLEASDQFLINKIVSLAVKECVRKFVMTPDITVKWPNDIYAGNRKIAGILSRNSISGNQIVYSIVGIGLNVNQEKFSSNIPNPSSFKMLTGQEFNLDDVMKDLGEKFAKYYQMLKNGNTGQIDALYLDALYKFNQPANFKHNDKRFNGIIRGVTRYGFLKIEVEAQIKEFDIKDVEFVID